MNLPDSTKPAIWGAIGGAVAAMFVGFSWAGWVTEGAAEQMEVASAETAVIQVLTPLCVAQAQKQPAKLPALKQESRWKHDDFVVEAGWVDNVNDKYQADVARACAVTLVKGMKTE